MNILFKKGDLLIVKLCNIMESNGKTSVRIMVAIVNNLLTDVSHGGHMQQETHLRIWQSVETT